MKKIIYLHIAFLLLSCSSTKVYSDYDDNIDFTSLKSYDYFIIDKTGLNQLDEKRIIKSLDSFLPNKGLIKSESPDIRINFFVEIYTVNNSNNVGVGLGTGGGRIGGGISGGIPINTSKEIFALTLDFIEYATNELIWQAVVESKYKENQSPIERQQYFDTLIAKVLEKYPPSNNK